MYVYIYILTDRNDTDQLQGYTNEDEERLVTWETLRKLNWWEHHFEHCGDKAAVFVIQTSQKSLYEVW